MIGFWLGMKIMFPSLSFSFGSETVFMKRTNWFDRQFPRIHDNGLMPGLIERLEGTPARLLNKLKIAPESASRLGSNHAWSLKKEVGHLLDLEPLWYIRLNEIKRGEKELLAADLTNRKTFETAHDESSFEKLVHDFSIERFKLVSLFRGLTDAEMENISVHPRLKTNMRAVDMAWFVAEHDDHHLAQIQLLMEEAGLI